jgi:hypothetical protein
MNHSRKTGEILLLGDQVRIHLGSNTMRTTHRHLFSINMIRKYPIGIVKLTTELMKHYSSEGQGRLTRTEAQV